VPAPVMSEAIGRVLTGADVEDAVRVHLATWLPTYVWELERQQGRDPDSVPMLRGVPLVSNDFEKWPEDQLPCMMIVATGLSDVPQREGSSAYRARWAIAVGVIASARTQAATNDLAKFYGAAVRAAMIQHRGLGGFARGVEWLDERYDDIVADDLRSLASATLVFEVELAEVIRSTGPKVPSANSGDIPPGFPLVNVTGTTTTTLGAP
jgi:hypothetical protein